MRTLLRPLLAFTLAGFLACSRTPTSGQQSGINGLSGWIAKSEINRYSSRLILTYYWFQPDGRVYFGRPPGGLSGADFNALQHSDPAHCGTYALNGTVLTLQRNGAAPETHSYSPGAGGIMDSSPLRSVWRLQEGAVLEGRWGVDFAVNSGGASISSSKTWGFHKNGAFEASGHGGVDTKSATGLSTQAASGRYQIAANKINLTYSDGTKKSFDLFGTDDPRQPYILGIDGVEYTATR